MMKYIFIIIFTLLTASLFSQSITWQRTYTNTQTSREYAYDICKADANNFYVVGSTDYPEDIYLMKINSLGDTLWTRDFTTNGTAQAYCIESTSDSGCIIALSSVSFPPSTIRYDKFGNIVWFKQYAGIQDYFCYNITTTKDNGFMICGNSNTNLSGFIIKTDASGNGIWLKEYTFGGQFIIFRDIAETQNGFIIVGNIDTNLHSLKILKVNNAGNILMQRNYIHNGLGGYDARILKHQNNYLIAGTARNPFTILIDDNLQILAINSLATNSNFNLFDFEKINENKYLYVLLQETQDSIYAFLVIGDSNGTVLKQKRLTASFISALYAGIVLGNGDIIACGVYKEFYEDFYVIRADTNLFIPPLSIHTINNLIPEHIGIENIYPNPFNSNVNIKFSIIKNGKYQINIINLLGETVFTYDDEKSIGSYKLQIKTDNLSSGIYIAQFYFEKNLINSSKLILIK